MRSLGEVLNLSIDHLKKRGEVRPRRIVEELLSYALGLERLQLYLQFDRPLNEEELSKMRQLISRKAKGEPLQYILGMVPFCNLTFEVNPSVLIPRPETEEMVQLALPEIKEGVAWDLCSGSGCIGISVKKARPHLQVELSDISQEAIALAKRNAKRNEVEAIFHEGDLLDPFQGRKCNILFCNPPYVTEEEWQCLDAGVKDYEPKLALVGGLLFYERLAKLLPSYLYAGAKLFFEMGHLQGQSLLKLFSAPCFTSKRIIKDISGKERFFFLEIE